MTKQENWTLLSTGQSNISHWEMTCSSANYCVMAPTTTVKLCRKAALDWNPHFLRIQVAHQPHSYRSCSSKKRPSVVNVGLNPSAFSHAKCLLTFETNLEQSQCQVSLSFLHLPDRFYGFCRPRILHISRPQLKAALEQKPHPKVKKIAHKPRLLYTT